MLESRTYAEVAPAFDKLGVWYGKVHDFDDVAKDPQVEALEVFRPTEVNGGTVTLVNHPNRYDGRVPELTTKGLKLGEHTREILTEYGYTPEQIANLLARKIVAAPEEGVKRPSSENLKIPAE